MGRFGHITKRVKVEEDVRRWHTLSAIPCPPGAVDSQGKTIRHPRLLCRPAMETNRAYWRAAQARNVDEQAMVRGTEDPATRNARNVRLYADHCIDGWEGFFEDGDPSKPIAHTRDAALEFLTELVADASWCFMDLFMFLNDPANFLPEDTPSAAGVKATSGN